MRLRRSDPARPGYGRRRRGRGFSYHDATGARLTDPDELARIRALAIPPAWRDVWICPDARGHIQAVGVDDAGRRQYRYHDVWRAKRDAAKFDHVLGVAERLPELRRVVAEHLAERGLTRTRVLAAAARLLDRGCFRVGGDEYATGDDATFGLATLRREHVERNGRALTFAYPGKGGARCRITVTDPDLHRVVGALLRRRDEQPELLAHRTGNGTRGWRRVRSDDINDYLREITGCDVTAKDFRTWQGTVLAALTLAGVGAKSRRSPTARKRTVAATMREVAEYLGNTPAVARASYVDPRVVDLFRGGDTLDPALADRDITDPEDRQEVERATLRLLRD